MSEKDAATTRAEAVAGRGAATTDPGPAGEETPATNPTPRIGAVHSGASPSTAAPDAGAEPAPRPSPTPTPSPDPASRPAAGGASETAPVTRAQLRASRPAPATAPGTGAGKEGHDPLLNAVRTSAPSGEPRSRVLRNAEEVAQRSTPAPVSAPVTDAEGRRRRGEAREAALRAKPVLPRIVQALLAVIYPFLLVIGALKAVASPWFLWLEYHRPGFPADEFGWDTATRLTYGSYGVDYLNNAAGPDYLAGLTDGSGEPLLLASEVAHMADVKAVLGTAFAAGLILLGLTLVGLWYLARRYPGGVRRALFAGALATLGVAAAIALAALVNWGAFFTAVHSVFFASGTWTFRYSDALIRLYPEQFWVDSAIAVGALVLVAVVVTLIATWPTASRRQRSRALVFGRRS